MLALRLKEGESVLIGKDIRIKYVELIGRQVRVGFEAPPELKIMREEVLRRMEATGK